MSDEKSVDAYTIRDRRAREPRDIEIGFASRTVFCPRVLWRVEDYAPLLLIVVVDVVVVVVVVVVVSSRPRTTLVSTALAMLATKIYPRTRKTEKDPRERATEYREVSARKR